MAQKQWKLCIAWDKSSTYMAFSCDPDKSRNVKLAVRAKEKAIDQMLATPYMLTLDGCWLWTGQLAKSGYGFVSVQLDFQRTKFFSVYRLSYEYYKSSQQQTIPNFCIRHTCNTRRCWNPEHLIPGTKQENAQDMMRAGHGIWQIAPPNPHREFEIVGEGTAPRRVNPLAAQVLANELERKKRKP